MLYFVWGLFVIYRPQNICRSVVWLQKSVCEWMCIFVCVHACLCTFINLCVDRPIDCLHLWSACMSKLCISMCTLICVLVCFCQLLCIHLFFCMIIRVHIPLCVSVFMSLCFVCVLVCMQYNIAVFRLCSRLCVLKGSLWWQALQHIILPCKLTFGWCQCRIIYWPSSWFACSWTLTWAVQHTVRRFFHWLVGCKEWRVMTWPTFPE